MSTEPIYNIVTHAHWDREWYLSFEEYRTWLVDVVDELFDRIERDPDFDSFLFDGQMAMVLDYLEVRPEMVARFKENARKKKFIIGPWYVLVDQFLPSGESHVRNLLYGLAFARELGEPMMVGYVPDQFGHIAQMPQILKGFNIDSAVVYRGFGGEPGQESSEYRWQAPDGTSVLMEHLPKDGYSFGYFGSDKEEDIPGRFQRLREQIDPRARTSQRLVLNGGDHHWADPNVTKAAKIISQKLGANVRLTNLQDFMARVKAEVRLEALPVVNGEMRFGIRHAFAVIGGTASSRMYIKQANYDCQNKLAYLLEPLNAIAVASGKRSRSGLIKHAWKYVLQSQDHDVICGSSIDSVYEETMVRYAKVEEIVRRTSIQIANDLIPFDGSQYKDDKHLFLFNLLPHKRSGIVESDVEFFIKDVIIGINPDVKTYPDVPHSKGLRLVGPDGREMPFQLTDRTDDFGITYARYSYPHQTKVDRWKLLVLADDLPALGYKAYSIEKAESNGHYESGLKVGDNFMENDFVNVKAGADGTITITDKATGEVYGGLNRFEDSGDIGDEYTYCPPDKGVVVESVSCKPAVRVVERGPLRGAIEITIPMKLPAGIKKDTRERSGDLIDFNLKTTVYLACDSKKVDVKTQVVNNARDHRLRAIFKSGIKTNISYADSQFCVVKREHRKYDMTGFPYELPQNLEILQRFVTVQEDGRAITVFTKGLPEYELQLDEPGTLALTLLRSVGNLSSSNLKTRPGGDAGWKNETPGAQCLGPQTFEYSILVHKPVEDFDEINRLAEEYNSTVMTVNRKHDVAVQRQASFLKLEGKGLSFSALKEAEDGNGLIFRCYNIGSSPQRGQLTTSVPFKSVSVANLEEVETSHKKEENNGMQFSAGAHSIVTLKMKF